jgi:hypothetical protein
LAPRKQRLVIESIVAQSPASHATITNCVFSHNSHAAYRAAAYAGAIQNGHATELRRLTDNLAVARAPEALALGRAIQSGPGPRLARPSS